MAWRKKLALIDDLIKRRFTKKLRTREDCKYRVIELKKSEKEKLFIGDALIMLLNCIIYEGNLELIINKVPQNKHIVTKDFIFEAIKDACKEIKDINIENLPKLGSYYEYFKKLVISKVIMDFLDGQYPQMGKFISEITEEDCLKYVSLISMIENIQWTKDNLSKYLYKVGERIQNNQLENRINISEAIKELWHKKKIESELRSQSIPIVNIVYQNIGTFM